MSRARRVLAAAGLAATCALLAAAPASAASRSYQVVNLSSHPLELGSVRPLPPTMGSEDRYKFDFEGRPEVGSVIAPAGDPHDFELKYDFLSEYAADITYSLVGTREFVKIRIVTTGFTNTSTCTIGVGQCTAEGGVITVLDAPGTTHEIPAGQAQAQADTLKMLCAKPKRATCRFTPTRDERLFTPRRLIGVPSTNCLDEPIDGAVGEEDTVTETNSLDISISAEFDTGFFVEEIKNKVVAAYGHAWEHEHSFKQDLAYKIKPGELAWVASSAPIFRDTGDFRLELGNTTWWLRDVYFDTPDQSRRARWTADHRPLTPAEYAAACPHEEPADAGPVDLPAGWAELAQDGTGAHELMRGGPERNLMTGGAGNDRLLGGPGRDRLNGGGGRDTLDGGSASDRMVDRRGATLVLTGTAGRGHDLVDVRDGAADDTVVCESERTIVAADPGDVVRGPCGRVLRTTTSTADPKRG